MIEFALLFGLGFLSAVLAGLLLAPVIHRRIVKFTEDRIMATMPVSPQELRAQKDMVRAEMATAIARTGHDLRAERDRAADLTIRHDRLASEASRLNGENLDLKNSIEDMKTEAADMRSSLRKEEIKLEKMQEQLSATEHSERMKDNRISDLLFRVQRLSTEVDSLKIDLVTRDTEVESLKVRINALRDERETLRNDLKLVNQRAKDAELRLAREENRTTRLEDRLNREISGSADKDTIIERRISEIGRLKDKLKTTTAEVREASRAAKPVMPMKPIVVSRLKNAVAGIEERQADAAAQSAVPELPAPIAAPTNRILSNEEVASLIDDVRSRTSVASDSLISMTDDSRDEAMRAEIADIAARMIAIVAQKEGMASPMRAMIAGKAAQSPHGRVALAERAANILRPEQPQP